ncbi:MAG: hypothetical protein KatS3mg077_1255 [Candidatus Binatia bacterium]|nr:MAG: hypothetical protein KatS3mg077_1255 [Candidatus Binatia bacterium]
MRRLRQFCVVAAATLVCGLFAGCGDDGEPLRAEGLLARRIATWEIGALTDGSDAEVENAFLSPGRRFAAEVYEVPAFPCVRTDSDDYLHIPEATTTPGLPGVFLAVPPADPAAPILMIFHGNGLDFIEALASLFVHAAPRTAMQLLHDQPGFVGFIEILNRGGALRGLRGESSGSIAAAALERGWGIVVPGNCWGDGGHHRGEVIDYYITAPRFGRSMDDFVWHWARTQLPHDRSREYSFGCSGGGQRTAQLLLSDPHAVAAAAVDSPADYLPGFKDDPPGLFSLLQGIPGYMERLDGFYLAHYGTWENAAAQSLGTQLLPRKIDTPIYMAYSSRDPLVTGGISRRLAEALAQRFPADRQVVWDTGEAVHCQINTRARAEAVLDWLVRWQR